MPLLHLYTNNMVLHFNNCNNSFIIASQAKHLIPPLHRYSAPVFCHLPHLLSHIMRDPSKDFLIVDLHAQVTQVTQCLTTLKDSTPSMHLPPSKPSTHTPCPLPHHLHPPTVHAVTAIIHSFTPCPPYITPVTSRVAHGYGMGTGGPTHTHTCKTCTRTANPRFSVTPWDTCKPVRVIRFFSILTWTLLVFWSFCFVFYAILVILYLLYTLVTM